MNVLNKAFFVYILIDNLYSTSVIASQSNCGLNGLNTKEPLNYYTIEEPISNTYEGIIATFNTTNIKEIVTQKSEHLEATLIDNVLSVFTIEKYSRGGDKNKNKCNRRQYNSEIQIEIVYSCNNLDEDSIHNNTIIINQPLSAIKALPNLNKEKYDYKFGMTIPKNYELSQILPIMATNSDGKQLYFFLEFNEHFKVTYKGNNYDSKGKINCEQYSTALVALQDIKPPFEQAFTLVAMDNANEMLSKNSTALITISVYEGVPPTLTPETTLHHPVFSKHLYFGNYTNDNELNIEETITFTYGAQVDTIITQSDFEEYINIELDAKNINNVNIQIKKPLPDDVINSLDILTIEIKAVNKNVKLTGRTALLIRLPGKGNKDVSLDTCGSNTYTFNNTPVIVLTTGMLVIIFVNATVVIWYFYKNK